MTFGGWQKDPARRGLCATLALAALVAVFALALPAGASAVPCPGGTTSWLGGSGEFGLDANWSNGGPSNACDVLITAPGTYTVSMVSGANMKSIVIGGASGTQTLSISGANANTNLSATGGASSITANGAVVLGCPGGGCAGGGGPALNALGQTLTNAGSITVDASTGGSTLSGGLTNTGTIQINGPTTQNNGTLLNQGQINIADGQTLSSSTSSCGDSTGAIVKNDTGGQIAATGTGTLSVVNYEQGNGSTSGTLPVQLPCGSLKYTGNGTSKVQANGGFALTGTLQSNQSLTVSAAGANTNAVLGGTFVNNGAITLTCPGGGCSGGAGGGAGFNANGNAFTNAGTFTVAAASGTGASLTNGPVTNTGTLQFDQSAFVGADLVNKGKLNIADGKVVSSSGSSCGSAPLVRNDTGGQIVATGTGTLSVVNYEQGAGTTSGTAPVQIPCGSLKYSGAGAGTVQVNGNGTPMTGNLAAGQTLRIVGGVTTGALANAGTILLDQSGSTLNPGGLVTNTGRIAGVGTVNGSVENTTGTVAPGASPGTLTINGNFTQGAGGTLEIEVEGTGAGQFDRLAVNGNAGLGGTVALKPNAAYASAAAIGDSVSFLTYGGTRTNPFAQATTAPELACPKQFGIGYDDPGKKASAVVSSSGSSCGGGEGGNGGGSGGNGGGGSGGGSGGGGNPPVTPAPSAPDTRLGSHPKATVKTAGTKASVSFTFSASGSGISFECKLDKGAYKPCKSPASYKAKLGKHTFSVRAVRGGVADGSPATFSFKVVKKTKG